MKLTRIVPTALAAAALTGALATPATAETVVRRDPRGDAPDRIDTTRAAYAHGEHRVRVVARVPKLGKAGTADLLVSRYEIFEAGYVVRIRERRDKPARLRLLHFDHFDLVPVACEGLSGSWGQRRVRLSVPRSCLTGHATNRVFTQLFIAFGSGEQFDEVRAVKRLRRG